MFYFFAALAPTDTKLVHQYMVLDNMQAHYKKLNSVKCILVIPLVYLCLSLFY